MAKRTRPRAKAARAVKPAVPKLIYAQASPRSAGGVSLFDVTPEQITQQTAPAFFSHGDVLERAARALSDAGFQVLQISAATINIAGTQATYEKAFAQPIVAEERPTLKGFQDTDDHATFLESPETELPGLISTEKTRFAELLEGVALEEPRYFFGPSMFPPLKKYWHLDVPAGVSLGCNADKAHRSGITGRGVKVAMVDSGHFKHPFFTARGYRVAPVVLGPAAANPTKDESGHGTGESANIFAVAPDVELLPVKINFVNSIGAFNAAVGLNPDIITCSWGSDKRPPFPLSAADLALAAAIASAVAAGITVIFSAGNGHHGFPGQHPDVISAGGVFMDVDESLRASDYASSFVSHVFPGRRCPDLCGLVGMKPKAIYIMLPLEPGDAIDTGNAGGVHPNGDETATNDGWAAFSGTSAAAPQLAGAAALVKEACSKLTPAQIKDALVKGARDVTTGKTNNQTADGGNTAVAGPDLATGTGLVDAHKSVLLAKVKCLPIIGPPITPIPPIPPVPPIPIVGPPVVAPPVVAPPIVGPPIVAPPVVAPPIVAPPVVGPQPPQPPVVGPAPPLAAPSPAAAPAATPAAPAGGQAGQAASRLTEEDVSALQDLIIRSELDG